MGNKNSYQVARAVALEAATNLVDRFGGTGRLGVTFQGLYRLPPKIDWDRQTARLRDYGAGKYQDSEDDTDDRLYYRLLDQALVRKKMTE